jgi:hypothetical protein
MIGTSNLLVHVSLCLDGLFDGVYLEFFHISLVRMAQTGHF